MSRWLMGTTALRRWRSYCSFVLVLSILLVDSYWLVETGMLRAPRAEAAVGDFSVFREVTGTETISGTGNAVTWDTTVSASGNISLQPNTSDIDLAEGGKYLVLYNTWTEEGALGGTNRRSIASYLTLNGTALAHGWGAGYIRDSENDLSAYNTGAAIIDATAGDDLAVELDRDDSNAGAGSAIRPGTNGVSVVKLDDDLDYLRVSQAANSSDISGNTSFTAVTFDTATEVDTGSFAFTGGGSSITLSGAADQFFLVTFNVKLNSTVGNRQNYEARLALDGAEVPGTRTTTYLRGTNGVQNGTMQYVGIIKKTSASDEVLTLQVRRESVAGGNTTITGGQTGLTAVALPTEAAVLSLTNNSAQALTSAASPMNWNQQLATAPTYFTHSTSTNNNEITIAADGNYLVFATTYTTRTSGTGRDVPRLDWVVDSTTQSYGGHGSFNRGDQGTEDTFTSGGSGGAVFPGLTTGQVLELDHSDETTGTPVADFGASQVALQAVEISTLQPGVTTNVSVSGSQVANTAPNVTNLFLGEQYAIVESSAARNVTNIRFTEAGTIDASSGLANVELYYDLDTSSPYNCASESYTGSELQYGSTGSFGAPNGTVTFTDSVSISPTQALCLYVVTDVTASAADSETIEIYIADPTIDVVATGDPVIVPATTVGESATVVVDTELTQTGYHWRNDDGNETGATSATGGVENTPGLAFSAGTPQRLRVGVAVGGSGFVASQFRLEYAEKVTTCDVASGWTSVDAVGGAWDMFDSTFIFESGNTTNIPVSSGGVTDGGDVFVDLNGGVRDVTSQTGTITLSGSATGTIAEFGNTTVTNGSLTTINLTNGFFDPVVVASVRYPRTGTQRTPRIDNKASSSFDILIDNFDSSLTGTTNFDYVVFERGDWLLADGGSGTRIYADSVSTGVNAGRPIPTNPGGPTVTYPTAFAAEPAVIATVVTRNDPSWVYASVYQGADITNPPGTTDMSLFLNDNFDADGHGSNETIDFLVFEQGHDTSNSQEFDAVTTGAATVDNNPTSVSYSTAYSATPAVILVQSLTHNGTDGGYAQVDTNTAPTASVATVSIDEEGLAADRAHAAEEVAVISFTNSGGDFIGPRADLADFVELEYSIDATGSAVEGVGYCFRVTDAGTPLRNYDHYAEATLNADVTVGATSTYIASVSAGTSNQYLGGQFSVVSNSGNHTLTQLTFTEVGTIDASAYLSNFRVYYESDTTNPRDCASESYDGTEAFATGSAFVSDNGTSTVTLSSPVRTNESFCAYLVVDVAGTAPNGAAIAFEISNPNTDAIIAGASVGPGSAVAPSGSTTVNAPSLSQTGYHWRNDDGSEAGATSASGGTENTPIGPIFQGDTKRVRFAVSNNGGLTATGAQFQIEYGTKVTTCANVGSWTPVDSGAAFDMASSSQLVDGNDTNDLAIGSGGVTSPNTTLVSPNSGQIESSDTSGALTISTTEYVKLEYALHLSSASAFGATYCFRLTDSGTPLQSYTQYAELTVQERQDFFVQRGTETVSGTGLTLTAGVDYTAPAATSSAFVRITNTSMTGAGSDTLGATRNPDDLFAYIAGPVDLSSSFTIERPSTATDNTQVSWEIVEYIGIAGGDNEFIVRAADAVTYGGTSLTATGSAVTGIADDRDVVVFITGQQNPAASTADLNTGLSISSWASTTDQPVFERGDADGIAAGVSYAVVEFTGASWQVQRIEHTYSAAGVTETEPVTAVNSLLRTFIHTQKLSGDELFNLDETGHEVWLSSIGAVSFELENGSTNPSEQRSVAWVIENTQTGDGTMTVYRSNDLIPQTTGQPTYYQYPIGATVVPENASIFANTRSTGAGSAHPRAFLGASILNETQFELFKSDEGQNQNFRVEVIVWPVAEVSLRQTHYRFYADNDALTPTDPWPPGASNLGENTAMTDLDEPLGQGEQVRVRVGLFINNVSLVADSVSFKLQYGRRDTTCSAVAIWNDVDAPGGGGIWRSYTGSTLDGTELSTLLLSTSNVAGTYESANPSVTNPNAVPIGDYLEYDWTIENNGALQKTSYCFRMVESDGAVLDGYDVYPTVRTSGYTPVIVNWRWYDDADSLTPTSPLAGEQVTPVDIAASNTIKLRVALTEIEGAPGQNIKFNLQYSEWADFRDGGVTLFATSSCTGGTRQWCYADGAGNNNDIIDTTVLSGVDVCTVGVGVGCGTVNEAAGLTSTYDQPVFTTAEHEFTLQHDSVGFDKVYYFRLFDATTGAPVFASSSYPSLATEGAALTFNVVGLDANQTFEGVTLDATTTATSIPLGTLPVGASVEAAQRLTVYTNGTEGYRIYLQADQQLTNVYGETIPPVSGNNIVPTAWTAGCSGLATGCFGYHAGDNTLYDGSLRFALDDSYAALSTLPEEVMASGVPVTFDTSEVIYRIQINETQPAGDYATTLRYIAVPIF